MRDDRGLKQYDTGKDKIYCSWCHKPIEAKFEVGPYGYYHINCFKKAMSSDNAYGGRL